MALLLLSVACSTADRSNSTRTTTQTERTRLCDIYLNDGFDIVPPTIEDTLAHVEEITRRATRYDQELLDAASPSEREIIGASNATYRRYRTRLLSEWRLDGGPALHDRAVAAGYLTFREYVESLAFEDPAEARLAQRASSALLAAKCDRLASLTDQPLADDLPEGEILATSVGSHTIRRFSPAGDDLGAIDVPGLGGEITFDSLSPDGNHLAVISLEHGRQRLSVIDLRDGSSTDASATGCVDWEDNSTMLVWTREPAGNRLVRLGLDGSPVVGTTDTAFDGCLYRYTTDRWLTVRPRVDGAPSSIQTVPVTGGEPTTLIETTCNLVSPRISPDGTALAYAAGCNRASESGLFIANSDGSNQRHLVRGISTGAAWSPDGRWLTFAATSTEHAGDPAHLRVYAMSADGTRIGVVSPPGFTWAVWRPTAV